jgi:hypothetical protein
MPIRFIALFITLGAAMAGRALETPLAMFLAAPSFVLITFVVFIAFTAFIAFMGDPVAARAEPRSFSTPTSVITCDTVRTLTLDASGFKMPPKVKRAGAKMSITFDRTDRKYSNPRSETHKCHC